jgi:hypothetical protein
MTNSVPSSGIILNVREEKVIQAFREHKAIFCHFPPAKRFLQAGKLHGTGNITHQSLIDKGLLEFIQGKGWRLTSVGWDVADTQ